MSELASVGPATVAAPGADRRAWVRQVCNWQGSVRALGEGTGLFWEVTILDVSPAGISLYSSRRFEPKTYLAVERDAVPPAPRKMRIGRVIHVRKAEDQSGWIIGCAFASKLSQDELKEWSS